MKEERIERSEFFRRIVQGGLLMGLLSLGVALIWKSSGKPTCQELGYCGRCAISSGCLIRSSEDEKQ